MKYNLVWEYYKIESDFSQWDKEGLCAKANKDLTFFLYKEKDNLYVLKAEYSNPFGFIDDDSKYFSSEEKAKKEAEKIANNWR